MRCPHSSCPYGWGVSPGGTGHASGRVGPETSDHSTLVTKGHQCHMDGCDGCRKSNVLDPTFRYVRKKKRLKPGGWSVCRYVLTVRFAKTLARLPPALPFVVFILFIMMGQGRIEAFSSGSTCRMEVCVNEFVDRLELLGPEFEGSDFGSAAERMRGLSSGTKLVQFCRLLSDCASCLDNASMLCYADFNYRSALKIVSDWRTQFDCEHHAAGFADAEQLPARQPSCTFVPPDFISDDESIVSGDDVGDNDIEDDDEDAHCSLFGDPHLIKYDGQFQTCQIEGAWPLVDNEFIAVQVTNLRVCSHCRATAAVRVTVIVKDAGECGPQSTYEATSQVLSKSFNDGTTFAGLDKSTVVEERLEGREVQIRVRHAGSVLTIRRVGGSGQFPSLSISVRTPRALIPAEHKTAELCAIGCPPQSRMDTPDLSLGLGVDLEQAVKACSRRELTDAFLDACVFDLITTGDLGFAEAAQLAQSDLWTMNPRVARAVLSNRTYANPKLLIVSSCAASVPSFVPFFILTVFMARIFV